jgi:hypothetical protein
MEQVHIKKWILGVLAGAQEDHASDLVLNKAADGAASIRYRTDGTWHEWAPASGIEWSQVLSELAGLAGIRDAPFPKEGMIYLAHSGVRLRWQIKLTSPDAECVLRNLGSDML